jgi:hypothetical protein
MSVRVTKGAPQPQGPGEDPLTHYTRVFVRFLQLVFASFEKGAYKWEPDMALTDIVIQDQGTISLEVVEKRPAIIVSRGPVAMTNVGMDQFAGPLLDQKTGRFVPNQDVVSGAKRHTDLYSSSMTYNCLAREGLEAQRIAWICAYATRTLKKALLSAGMHRVGEEVQVGAESGPGTIVQPDSGEISMVSVSVPFYYQDTWTIETIDKTLLTRIDLALRSEVGYPAADAVLIRQPGFNGRTLYYDKLVSLNQDVTSNMAVDSLKK